MAEAMGRQNESVQWQAVADDIHTAAQTQLFDKDTGFFLKGFIRKRQADGTIQTEYDRTIDMSSFYGAFMFGLFDIESEAVQHSYETLKHTFSLGNSGPTPVPRYTHDNYRRTDSSSLGNPWFVTTLWLAQYHMQAGNMSQATAIVDFVRSRMMQSGVLAEQMDPANHKFISVAPLTWSQAEFINSTIDLSSPPTPNS
jgi:GH15 family glucan-1,4-alpha-glucosidase